MRKNILIVADIHIHDYANRNPWPRARLDQTMIVAKNIVEEAKKAECDYIAFAGDTLEKTMNEPLVLAKTKEFLDYVMSFFIEGWIIWGNHDQKNKSSDQGIEDSALGVMLPSNLHYADKQIITLGNVEIAFFNWRPDFDLSWISSPVDLLITHATINYSDDGRFKSQYLDQNKFDLAICGDIHRPAEKGKFISIGIPQKCKLQDSDVQTGIVYDCLGKTWKRIDLNPHDNLIKFAVTTDKDKKGWCQENYTWYDFKPQTLVTGEIVNGIPMPSWNDLEHLVVEAVQRNGLDKIHKEVMGNITSSGITYQDVDFGFFLKRLKCENWRSIEECDIYFNPGDRILIQGDNGSGKSSLLSAIKYAFVNRTESLKEFIQFGKNGCSTEVTFDYQGLEYKILRGYSSGKPLFGLWISGVAQKYGKYEEFKKDITERFPFTEYSDIFYFNSDHNKFIGDMKKNPERKVIILSKLLKLDHIDYYRDIAENLKHEISIKYEGFKISLGKIEEVIKIYERELEKITLPKQSLEVLKKWKQEGEHRRELVKEWELYEGQLRVIDGKLDVCKGQLDSLKKKFKNLRSIDIINKDIEDCDQEISTITSELKSLENNDLRYRGISEEIARLEKDEEKETGRYESLMNKGTCPVCHRSLEGVNQEEFQNHLQEILGEVKKIQEQLDKKKKELEEIRLLKEQDYSCYSELKKSMDVQKYRRDQLILEKGQEEILSRQLKDKEQEILYIEQSKSTLKVPREEKPVLKDDFESVMEQISIGIRNHEEYNEKTVLLSTKVSEREKTLESMNFLEGVLKEMDRYIKLMGPTGDIYQEIMKYFSEQFSDDTVKYETVFYKYRGKDKLDIISYFNNNGNWVSYDSCSDGQKTVLDIHFLKSIVPGIGVMIMDEFLKHLDQKNHELCLDTLKEMNVGCLLLSSHMESLTGFNSRTCLLKLNDSGITSVEVN